MKGRKFLKVTGILMVIGGALGIVMCIVAIIKAKTMAGILEVSSAGLIFASILMLAGAVFQLIAGIMGVKYCDRQEKAQTCLVMGVIVALLSVAGSVASSVFGNSVSPVNYAIGLVIPVLYIVGAVKNKTEV